MTVMPRLAANSKTKYWVFAIAMIRNDFDVVLPFLAQADELFDELFLVDVQSTDGTKEAITAFKAKNTKIHLYSIDRQEKYQSAIMNRLVREAFTQGADWVFLLDADEFINIQHRDSLQRYLKSFPDQVMYLPWINLVPSQYGTFTSFDMAQPFYWSGRTSLYNKVALSNLFIANNPNFYVHEGNHTVSRDSTSSPVENRRGGLTLLHLPVRSADRLKYRIAAARQTLLTKHNKQPGEGTHVMEISDLIRYSSVLADRELNAIAANYGDHTNKDEDLDPKNEGWPTLTFPPYVANTIKDIGLDVEVSLRDTLLRDRNINWLKADFAPGSSVCAEIDNAVIKIRPQPVAGSGEFFQGRYQTLPAVNPDAPTTINPNLMVDAINASFMKVKTLTPSAWSELIPALFCIFSITRPRRFVELGTHNGMCFFAACQATEALSLRTQCVAVDNWIGDPHASFHGPEVFDNFRNNIRHNYPQQFYVKANFEQASDCFEDESIDVLHIDGFHTYAAAKSDFEAWLPKVSQTGIIILHDIAVHERGFGVWRLWEELQEKYPSFVMMHCHGLGIIYVGRQPSAFADILGVLQRNLDHTRIVRVFFEALGCLSIEYRRQLEAGCNAHEHIRRLEEEVNQARRLAEEVNLKADHLLLNLWQKRAKHANIRRKIRHSLRLSLLLRTLQWKRDARTIRKSKLFDRAYYLAAYPDVKDTDPIWHFVRYGVYELRNPNPVFNTRTYLLRNKDVLFNYGNPFVHYIQFGQDENRLR